MKLLSKIPRVRPTTATLSLMCTGLKMRSHAVEDGLEKVRLPGIYMVVFYFLLQKGN